MRKLIMGLSVLLLISVSASYASIGWAGHQWPCNGASYADNQDVTFYMQVWKDGCTYLPGPCADIQATIFYKNASDGSWQSAPMVFNVDVGSNDEFMFTVPGAFTESGNDLQWRYELLDLSDNSTYIPDWISCGGGTPPWALHITPATETDVTVHFAIDMGCLPLDLYAAGVSYAGDFTGWSACNPAFSVSDPDGDRIYEGSYTFAAGSNPYHEFKFNRMGTDGCQWENSIGNRTFVIDDTQAHMYLPLVRWDNWNCCQVAGPESISEAGSYCVTLCVCPTVLSIPLLTGYSTPELSGVEIVPGCVTTGCNVTCEPGSGAVQWGLRWNAETNVWYIDLCITEEAGAAGGCFCLTIDAILPVELGGFDAVAGDGAVTLNWNTRSETDLARFDIERDGALLAQVASRGSSTSGHTYSWTDRTVANGRSYTYTLVGVDLDGSRNVLASESVTPGGSAVAGEFALAQNYPNPFNPTTAIRYTLAEAAAVRLTVYDLSGRAVAQLVNAEQAAGNYTAGFDARDLPSGVYYYRLEAGSFSAARKMVLMK